jgi:cell division protein FtsW (lipid II flippase)
MGFQPFVHVKDNQAFTNAGSGKVHRPRRLSFDVPLLLVVISLVLFGILMVYSASADYSFQVYGSPSYIFMRQLRWLALGTLAMAFFAWMDYHWWKKLALPLMAVAIGALIAVLLIQDTRLGSVRSLFRGSIQPSELAKFGIVIYLSIWLHNRRDMLSNIYLALIPLGVIMGVVGGLIALQPDLSAVITIGLLGAMMFFLAGGELKQFLFMMGLGILVGVVVLRSGIFPTVRPHESFIAGKDRCSILNTSVVRWKRYVAGLVLGLENLRPSSTVCLTPTLSFAVVGRNRVVRRLRWSSCICS